MEALLKILIVDDDRVDRMAVKRSLKKADVKIVVSEAVNAKEAIGMLKQAVFDCIFIDYSLPEESGLEFVQKLPKMGIKIPSIVLTGHGEEQIAVELMKAGASDYVSKSRVSPETLSHSLGNALRIHQAEMEAQKANQQLRLSKELLLRQNKELEKQRRQIELQNQQLLESSRLKSQFLANMSHELRTPMNAIMGFSQMLLRQYPDPLSDRQIDMVERIFKNADRLLTMLNEVLDFSQIEAGNFKMEPNLIDLADLVKITTEKQRSLAMEKQLMLHVNIEDEKIYIINNEGAVRIILANLISNAIKFTESGYVRIEVWEVDKERVAIAVKDTGIGIAKENLPQIFEAFRQADRALTRKYSGTGLGLALVKSLVQMMSGTITVESEKGKGSTFRVELPRNPVKK